MGKPWISVQISADMKQDLDEYCETNDIESRSGLLRDLLRELLYGKNKNDKN